nr:MAG TPA: hypothetical protein [Caudoviricetes sp.]
MLKTKGLIPHGQPFFMQAPHTKAYDTVSTPTTWWER